MPGTYRLVSPPPGGQAAIAIVQIHGDIDALLARLGVKPVAATRIGLREVPGVDTLLVARFAPSTALLFPHAGPAVVKRLLAALDRAGLTPDTHPSISARFPEAASLIEARMLAALARAQSPLAIDLLLDQPRRWALAEKNPALALSEAANTSLNRLIDPPLVVAFGAPNIGKSSLLNALAGRSVSIVADEPGTTRDHVGVMLDLGGLVVRFIDAPGMDGPPPPSQREGNGGWVRELSDTLTPSVGPDLHQASPHPPTRPTPCPSLGEGDRSILAEAQRLARDAAAGADLILLCADAGTRFLTPPHGPPPGPAMALRIALRADLGLAAEAHDLAVSAATGTGIEALVARIRSTLVPADLLADHRAWRFW